MTATAASSSSPFSSFHHNSHRHTSPFGFVEETADRDSPPGLTASGSSDDGSSPASMKGGGGSSSHGDDEGGSSGGGGGGGDDNAVNTPVGDAAAPTAKSPSSIYDTSVALSPSSASWMDSSSNGEDDGRDALMDWASPSLHFNHSHHFDEHDLTRYSSAASSSPSPAPSSAVSPAATGITAPGVAESKHELRDASNRIIMGRSASTGGGGDGISSSTASHLVPPTSQEEDEQMFDSIIEESSFGPASTSTSGPSSPQHVKPLSSAFGAMHIPNNTASGPTIKAEAVTPAIEHQQPHFAAPPAYPSTATMMEAMAAQNPSQSGQPQSHTSQMAMQQHQLPTPPKPSQSEVSSRRNSTSATPEAGPSNYADRSDNGNIAGAEGEITLSSSVVIRPSLDDLPEMEVHVHGIPAEGAKSRVETQIKAHVELVRSHKQQQKTKADTNSDATDQPWERIGSFTHLKLPPLSATKRKTKKNQQNGEIPKEKTLYLDVAVVTASPPHQRAFACTSCSERERKRAERRKSGRAKSGPIPSEEEMRRLGVDPGAPDAVSVAQERLLQEESKRIILFNCGDYVEFKDGHAELPTRITCYCRHHKEKLGFCILFTMRNWKGKTVACGSTPAIMITDDHKSSAALERFKREAAAAAAAAAANGGLPEPDMIVDSHHNLHHHQYGSSSLSSTPSQQRQRTTASVDRSRANSTETTDTASGNGGASRSSKSTSKRNRPKPYDSQRRSTVSSSGGAGASGTASHTGASSPTSVTQQQQQAAAQPLDLVQALAAIGSERAMQDAQNVAPNMADNFAAMAFQPPSPLAFQQQPLQGQGQGQQQQQGFPAVQSQQQSQPGQLQFPPHLLAQQLMQQQLFPGQSQQFQQPQFGNLLAEGSISPDTMATNPLSLPQLDFGNNLIAQQMLALLGQQGLLPRGFPAGGNDKMSNGGVSAPPPPSPVITKIIPGEGPTTGGMEVTVLGENFVDGLTCFFGDLAASSTRVWAANTLICVLPPSPSPGPVAVTVKDASQQQSQQQQQPHQRPLQLFTYIDKCDTQLMELALQVVGFQQTRTMQVPREIALRLLASGQGSINSNIAAQQQQQQQQRDGGNTTHDDAAGRNAVEGMFAASGQANFQDTIINFLTSLLEVDTGVVPRRMDAIRLSNRNGHTLLHLAVSLGFHRLVTRLLDLGCPIDARDRNGLTALHLAALNGRGVVVRTLVARGARVDIKSFAGLTPIDVALEVEQEDVAEVMRCEADRSSRLARVLEEDESSLEEDTEDVGLDADADNVSTGASSLDDDDDEGGWTDDGSDLEYDEGSDSESEDEDSESDEISEEEATPVPTTAATPAAPTSPLVDAVLPPPDEKKLLQERDAMGSSGADSKGAAAEKGISATPAKVSSLRSLANRFPTTGFGGFNLHNMPASAIAVFQMTMPGGGEADTDDADPSMLMSLWRNTAWSPWSKQRGSADKAAPPPAYESVSGERGCVDEKDKCRVPPPAPSSVDDESSGGEASDESEHDAGASASASASATSSKTAMVTAPAPPASRRMNYEDDWMLRWFWLPCLILALLVAAFSTGPLSLASLSAYVPK